MKNRLFNVLLIVGLLAAFFLTPAVRAEAKFDGFLREETITGNNPSATENDPTATGNNPSATENDPTATGNNPTRLDSIDVEFGEFVSADGKIRISRLTARVKIIDVFISGDDEVDYEKSELILGISNLREENGKFIFDVEPYSAFLTFKSGAVYECSEDNTTFLDMTINVKVPFTGKAKIEHKKNNTLVETLQSKVSSGTVSFNNKKGFSTFTISPIADDSSSTSSTTTKISSFDPNDKNHDGVITCDEIFGGDSYWDESKKSCIVNGTVAGKNYVPNTSTK